MFGRKWTADILKQNTDFVKCAMENNELESLQDESLLDDLEVK